MYRFILLFVLVLYTYGQEIEEISCTTRENEMGICVKHYLCTTDGRVITDGTTLLDQRFGEECRSLEVCCGVDDTVTDKPNPTTPTIAPPSKCGIRNKKGVLWSYRALQSEESQIGEFPWMVAVMSGEDIFGGEDLDYIYLCGGSLIHPKVVVTSAHNVLNKNKPIKNLMARAGEWDTRTENEPYPHQEQRVAKVIIHPNFKMQTLINDIGLLILENEFTLSNMINPICLPKSGVSVNSNNCIVTGWGKDSFGDKEPLRTIMKNVEMPIVPKDQCEKALRKTRLGSGFKLNKNVFTCAGGEVDRDACQGDGGSPLACPVSDNQEQYQLAGIVSWGIGCGQDGIPGVYTDVAVFVNWLRVQLNNNNIQI